MWLCDGQGVWDVFPGSYFYARCLLDIKAKQTFENLINLENLKEPKTYNFSSKT